MRDWQSEIAAGEPAPVVDDGWKPVVMADDLDPCGHCGEPYCDKCDEHYADCDCIGPHEDEDTVKYREIDGVLMARRIEEC
jgi:hypothetical protein